MRLDRLTIGSAAPSTRHQFRNLKNVTIDFDQDDWVTVLIGWNGTGKSNILEALAIIFRDLMHAASVPAFAYQVDYRMGAGVDARRIRIDADPDRSKEPYIIDVTTPSASNPARMKPSAFLADAEINLPRYVFSYYSGESHRMQEVFRSYLETYDKKLRQGKDPGLKRLFYALPVHSQFVLLASHHLILAFVMSVQIASTSTSFMSARAVSFL